MVYGASEGSCESVAAGGDGAFVAAAALCAHPRTSMLYGYQMLLPSGYLVFLVTRSLAFPYESVWPTPISTPTTAISDNLSTGSDLAHRADECMAVLGAKPARERNQYDDALHMG